MPRKIGFAIIGSGSIGKRHAEQINNIVNAKLVAVIDKDPIRAEKLAAIYDTDWSTNFLEIIKRPDIDIVNICTPSGLHSFFAIEAAKAKKHVVVEKPIDVTLTEADSIIENCKNNGVKLCVISQHRFNPSIKLVKKNIDEGKLGNTFLFESSVNWFRTQEYYDKSGWRGTWSLDGGGAFMNQSIHVIDLMQYLMGPVESVNANIGTFNHQNIEVEDTAVAIVKFKNGGLGTIVGTTAAFPGFPIKMNIFGTGGSAIIDSFKLTHLYLKNEETDFLKSNLAEGIQETDANEKTEVIHPHKAQLEDMIDAIINDREPLVNGKEGRNALEIVLAIYESAKSGKTVTLDPSIKQVVSNI